MFISLATRTDALAKRCDRYRRRVSSVALILLTLFRCWVRHVLVFVLRTAVVRFYPVFFFFFFPAVSHFLWPCSVCDVVQEDHSSIEKSLKTWVLRVCLWCKGCYFRQGQSSVTCLFLFVLPLKRRKVCVNDDQVMTSPGFLCTSTLCIVYSRLSP